MGQLRSMLEHGAGVKKQGLLVSPREPEFGRCFGLRIASTGSVNLSACREKCFPSELRVVSLLLHRRHTYVRF